MTRKRTHHGNRRHGNHPKAHRPKTLLEGTVEVLGSRVAQVSTAEGTFAVARRGLREAMNGDKVLVSLVPTHGRLHEPVAYVQSVLERSCLQLMGVYEVADPLGVVKPLDARLGHDFFVLPDDSSACDLGVTPGDVVRATIVEYPSRCSAGVATVVERLGTAEELDVHVETVIASYGLPGAFPRAVLDEAEAVRTNVEEALREDALRQDLRSLPCFTVDPADARDYDDAVGAQRRGSGYRVYVHIADVTQYVPEDSSLDLEARSRACSAYLVDRVIPMLPERLCNDVCSLRPGEDRLAMSVQMELDAAGEVLGVQAFPSVIRSNARLTYDQADAVLAGVLPTDELPGAAEDVLAVTHGLQLLDEVARLRADVRRKRGAVDFNTVECRAVLDGRGRACDVSVRARTRATSLVEEAMLLANEGVARMLAERDVACAYRVHERPLPEDLARCAPVLQELGLANAEEAARLESADPFALQAVLDRARGTGEEFLANSLLLKAQRRAVYEPHNLGHYALGAAAYCHFTSPIRRYPDMLVHRALKRLPKGNAKQVRPQAAFEQALPQICRSCSDRERAADAASRASQRIKLAELYDGRRDEVFAGTVAGCERYGLFVLLDGTYVEGMLPVRSLGDQWFAYDERRLTLTGESTGRVWRVGDRVRVRVDEVDVARGRIDFALAK